MGDFKEKKDQRHTRRNTGYSLVPDDYKLVPNDYKLVPDDFKLVPDDYKLVPDDYYSPFSQTENTPDPDKVKKVLQHLIDKKWDVDSLTRDLTNEEMNLYLKVEERFQLIKYIAEGFRVSTEDEETILRLVETTPKEDVSKLTEYLNDTDVLNTLKGAIDHGNYVKLHQLLRALVFESKGEVKAASEIESLQEKEGVTKSLEEHGRDKVFYWLDPALLQNFSFHLNKILYENMKLKNGKLSFDLKLQQGPMISDQGHFELDPFEIISLKFLTSVESIKTEEGKTEYIPAINLLVLDNEKFHKDLREAIDVAFLFAGGAGLLAKGTRLGKLLAGLEAAYGVADLTINSFRSKISETEVS